ncbi:hypothetical protein HMP0721_2102 [Pseudoramibacter alactolyticus ATCC 23263]|uniref:Uncharacterized protein n=1 Tax=Pseudoramibacter alactolyticus ATCC 23263 TaxID=887929 RepID=E6MJB7_9FIRM|nr:hypothetical protein HMP0721_2102 [Pseudoramibacter alactolyticus ATCC 23263]
MRVYRDTRKAQILHLTSNLHQAVQENVQKGNNRIFAMEKP